MTTFFLKKNQIFIIIIFKVYIVLNDYISIPFKKYQESINNLNAEEHFMNVYLNNNIYLDIQIGQPSQNIKSKINSLEFEFLMKNENKLPFERLNSNFSVKLSSTFSIIEKADNNFPNSKYVRDNFMFCVNYDIINKKCKYYKTYDNINFVYTDVEDMIEEEGNNNKVTTKSKKYTYLEIGLNYKSYYNSNTNPFSLLSNLIKNNYINNNTWFISFFNKTNNVINNDSDEEDKGLLVFGSDPANFFNKKYNITSCLGVNKYTDYTNSWSIIFDEIKQRSLKRDNKDIIIQNNLQGVINFNYDVIVGNEHYLDIIIKTFFLKYITEGACNKRLAKNKFYYFVCNGISLPLNEIKINFPSLYFKKTELNYIFELTAEDLFVQFGSQIYFLIVFNKNNPTNSFLLGNIFLKKYIFSFENKSKKIFFYKLVNEETDKNKIIIVNQKQSTFKIYIIMTILIVIFCLIGFYFGKKMYNKRKIRANELEEQFEYNSQKDSKKLGYLNI